MKGIKMQRDTPETSIQENPNPLRSHADNARSKRENTKADENSSKGLPIKSSDARRRLRRITEKRAERLFKTGTRN
jgi:hypothetical protein